MLNSPLMMGSTDRLKYPEATNDRPYSGPMDNTDLKAEARLLGRRRNAPFQEFTNARTAVVDGFNPSIRVRDGHLVIEDGYGELRTRRYPRHDRTLRRVIVLARDGGYLTLEAVRWCHDTGVTLVHLDPWQHDVLAVVAPKTHTDGRLVRSQAVAPDRPYGLELARVLIRAKLNGQAEVVRDFFGDANALDGLEVALGNLDHAGDLFEVRAAEADGAASYFDAWKGLRTRWAQNDQDRVPDRWRVWEGRSSPVTGERLNRHAGDPINAALNFGYALAEASCWVACQTVGLSPSMGLLHPPQLGRESLPLDLIEPVRPLVDRVVLDLLARTVLTRADVAEGRDGVVRLMPTLTNALAASSSAWDATVGRVAERAAKVLGEADTHRVNTRSPYTRLRAVEAAVVVPRTRCESCGDDAVSSTARYCHACLRAERVSRARELSAASVAALTELRLQGVDPTRSPEALAAKRAAMSRNKVERDAWDAAWPDAVRDPAVYWEGIFPLVSTMSNTDVRVLTGLSVAACANIRKGRSVPHARWWGVLAGLCSSP